MVATLQQRGGWSHWGRFGGKSARLYIEIPGLEPSIHNGRGCVVLRIVTTMFPPGITVDIQMCAKTLLINMKSFLQAMMGFACMGIPHSIGAVDG